MLLNQDNGPEKSIRAFDPLHFRQSMMIHCLPSLLLGKHIRPALKDSPSGVFVTISARVGSITDNRLGGWYSYRASKVALNMALKCLAIEWARNTPNFRVAALHPGITDTPLSKPLQQNVLQGKLFSPDKAAQMLISQIEQLHEQPSGRFIAFDGAEIPW
jgi:NAD(P)-dependent dehydrogenase (short-subunit alcohol dehydrogenase family)